MEFSSERRDFSFGKEKERLTRLQASEEVAMEGPSADAGRRIRGEHLQLALHPGSEASSLLLSHGGASCQKMQEEK
jgi:hypothetical protein